VAGKGKELELAADVQAMGLVMLGSADQL